MESRRPRLLRVSTVPLSLKMFCKDLLIELAEEYDVLAVSSAGAELDEIKASGIPVETVDMVRQISIADDLRALHQLIKLFRRYRPDIVHSLTPKAGLLSMMAARFAGVPVRIHSFTGLVFPTSTGIKRLILKTTDRITCACASHVLPEGEGVAADLRDGGITRKPLHVLGHGNLRGIDLGYYDHTPQVLQQAQTLRHRLGIADDAFVFVFVGRVVRDKGISHLVEAHQRLIKSHPDCHLLLVGPLEAEDPLPDDTLRLIRSCSFIHHIDTWIDDVRPYYAMSQALAFPSYREGFPNVVLEAGAMGLPSIVTDINGSREIIIPGKNGIIIPPHDTTSLYKAMQNYLLDAKLLQRHASNARRLIADRYEASYVRNCLKSFYKTLL